MPPGRGDAPYVAGEDLLPKERKEVIEGGGSW